MIDYEILKLIWWLFIAVLLTGFAIMDGQDMGAGTLLPFLGKTNEERRIMINAVAPHWDGNEVWLLTGAGAMFAAWPIAYATAFSGFYWALLIVLFMLIFRPVAFDYRSKVDSTKWRTLWDTLLFLGSAVPPIICGVAFGNLLQGVPFRIDTTMRVYYEGSFFALLNPFALLCGVVSIAMVIMHGANYLTLKTEGDLQARSARVSTLSSAATFVLFALAGIWLAMAIPGYTATGLDRSGWLPEPAREVCGDRRQLVRQPLRSPLLLSASCPWPARLAPERRLRQGRQVGFRDRCLFGGAPRYRDDAVCHHVPVRDAVLARPSLQPYSLGLHELPAHA